MGNAHTCYECDTAVPKTIRFCPIYEEYVYKRLFGETWIKIKDNEYLCPNCLKKRNSRLAELKRKKEQEKTKESKYQSHVHNEQMKHDSYRRQCSKDLFSAIYKQHKTECKIKIAPCDKMDLYDDHYYPEAKKTIHVDNKKEGVIILEEIFVHDCEENYSDCIGKMTNSCLHLCQRLQWNDNQLSLVLSRPFFQTNPKESAVVLHLLEIHAFKPNDIIHVCVKGFLRKKKSSIEITVLDFLSKESSNIEDVKTGLTQRYARSIVSIIHEMKSFLQDDDLSRMKRIVEHIIKNKSEKGITPEAIKKRLHSSYVLRKIYSKCGIRRESLMITNENILQRDVFDICKAVYLTKTYWPNYVQISALLCLYQSHKKGMLLEVKTGEGKSCIVAMFAALLCLGGFRTVDIISSSCVLACRDSHEWGEFFHHLNISVTHNITLNDQTARQQCYSKNVVYGTVGTFASDILREEFLLEETRSGREFAAVIVDEVDSLLLDNGIQFTYLSHAVPGLHHIEPILLMIWNEVVRYTFFQSNTSRVLGVGRIEPFHEILLSCVNVSDEDMVDELIWLFQIFIDHGILQQGVTEKIIGEISQGRVKLNEKSSVFRQTFDSATMLRCLKVLSDLYGIEFEPFKFDADTCTLVRLKEFVTSERAVMIFVGENGCLGFAYSRTELIQSIEQKVMSYLEAEDHNKRYEIPQNLMTYVKSRLNEWIKNAFFAKEMRLGREYLVTEKEVVPIDFESTGVVEHGTKWSDCLHQFLEIKHSKQLSQISVVTNFMSNQAFFERYKSKIFGLSGTLGTDEEISYLYRQFNLNCMNIPTNEKQKFFEIPGFICENTQEWISSIHHCLLRIKQQGRPILMICEDINKTEMLNTSLDEIPFRSKIGYNRNDVETHEIKQFMGAGYLIIATNIAGRGTDLHMHADVNDNGGLFVLVTFLPLNERVEKQIFGRTARKGQTGSAQIIIDRTSLPSELAKIRNLSDLKELRNKINDVRLGDYHSELTHTVQKKERLFKLYCKYLQDNSFSNDECENKIYRNAMHEFWGFWLKANFKPYSNMDELETNLRMHFYQALQKAKSHESPNSNLCHIINIANEEMEKEHFDIAKRLFTKAIEHDNKWAAIAFYNRALCSLRQRFHKLPDVIEDLKKARESFAIFKEENLLCVALIQATPCALTDPTESGSIMLQMQTRCVILGYLEENIQNALSMLEEMQRSKKEIDVEVISSLCIALGDNSYEKINDEMLLFWEMGLQKMFSIRDKPPFSWKGLVVTAFGILQISVGALMIASSSGLLLSFGQVLVNEGIHDIYTGIHAIIKRDNSFAKSWAISKVAGLAISFATFGVNAFTSKQGLQMAYLRLKNEVKTAFTTAKGAIKANVKSSCTNAAKCIGKEFAKSARRYFIELSKTKVKETFEKRALNEITKHVHRKFSKGFQKDVKNLVCYLVKEKKPDDIRTLFRKDFRTMMSGVHSTRIGPLMCKCVKNVVTAIKKDCNEGFTQDCLQIFELFDSLKYETCDISHLVDLCIDKLEIEINGLYRENMTTTSQDQEASFSSQIDDIVKKIESDTVEEIFWYITDTFVKTGDTLLGDKLSGTLHSIVTTVTEGKSDKFASSAFDITDTFAEGDTQKQLKFVVTSARKAKDSIMSGKKEKMISSALDITENAVDTFAEGETKNLLRFGVASVRRAKDIIM